MIYWVCTLFNKIRFSIKPTVIYVSEYWWVKEYGRPVKICISSIDGNIVRYKTMGEYWTGAGPNVNFIYNISWIRQCQE